MRLNSQGIAPIFLVLVVAAITTTLVVISNQNKINKPTPSPFLTASLSSSPGPTPTATPSFTPKPTPLFTPQSTTPPAPTSVIPSGGYSRVTVNTERGTFTTNVVTLPIGARMVTDTASDSECGNDCPTLPLADFVSRNGGYAGIHGSYFCPATYDECQDKKNSFDFPVYNSRLNRWINQGTLFWNDRSVIYQDGTGIHYLQTANSFSGGLTAGVVNYPGILNNGQVMVGEGLSEKQSSKGTKGGIGFNSTNIFLVVASNIDMADFAAIFKAIGASYAINLDGGGSVALWYGGYKVGPGRGLPNAIVFK